MGTEKSSDFASFASANPDKSVDSFDYVKIIYQSHHLHPDFPLHFAKMFWPDFKIIDGLVYLCKSHSPDYYEKLKESTSDAARRQYFWNLFEITGLFEELSNEEAMSFAETLAACWNAKMAADFGDVPKPARAIFDEAYDEVYVTIGSPT